MTKFSRLLRVLILLVVPVIEQRRMSEPSGDEADLSLLSPEERDQRRKFEQKRKAHYNEFYALKMARQLIAQEEEEEEDGQR